MPQYESRTCSVPRQPTKRLIRQSMTWTTTHASLKHFFARRWDLWAAFVNYDGDEPMGETHFPPGVIDNACLLEVCPCSSVFKKKEEEEEVK